MSTRAIIAEPTGTVGHWRGRYHHFDGYPNGLGRTLHELFGTKHFPDVETMRRVLLHEHTAWSTINGVDWDLTPGFSSGQDFNCAKCGAHQRAHYRQHYADQKLLPPPAMADPTNPVLVLGHGAEAPPKGAEAPRCYCHGERSEVGDWITDLGDDAGAEWAYVLESDALVVYERRYGGHGFGPSWCYITAVAWEGEPFNADRVEKIAARR